MYKHKVLLFLGLSLLATGSWGCGDDENGEPTPDASVTDAGTDAGGDAAADAATDAGDPQPVACGTTECQPIVVDIVGLTPIGVVPACCRDAATGECGADLEAVRASYMTLGPDGCTPFELPGVLDTECPGGAYELPLLMMSLPLEGCCRPEGTCGVWADMSEVVVEGTEFGDVTIAIANFGCVAREDYLANPGEPTNCEYVAPEEVTPAE